MTLISARPLWLNANSNVYTAWDLRSAMETAPDGEGVAGYEDWRVLQRQAGANMSVDIGSSGRTDGPMRAWVRGDTRLGQAIYLVDNLDRTAPTSSIQQTTYNEVVTANASGNPRLDQVILEIADAQHAGASNLAQIRVVAGTPNAGATLDTRTGAAALPSSAILLADVIVANGAASIVTANIRDRRSCPIQGVVPWLLTARDAVLFDPTPLPVVTGCSILTTSDPGIVAYRALLPRRIVGATRLRWWYEQQATQVTGNWRLGVYDLSGRLIVETGNVAFTGVGATSQEAAGTIGATDFDAGFYFVTFSWDLTSGGGSEARFQGVVGTAGLSGRSPTRNLVLGFEGGSPGGTMPTTLLALTDGGGTDAPLVAVSVG